MPAVIWYPTKKIGWTAPVKHTTALKAAYSTAHRSTRNALLEFHVFMFFLSFELMVSVSVN
jgi:hypothetical protein